MICPSAQQVTGKSGKPKFRLENIREILNIGLKFFVLLSFGPVYEVSCMIIIN